MTLPVSNTVGLFKRGYLIVESENKPTIPDYLDDWTITDLRSFSVYTHPLLTPHHHSLEKIDLILVGRVIDPVNDISAPGEIASDLASELASSKIDFFRRLDHLTGKFIVFVERPDDVFALQDATGNLSLFYDTNPDLNILASHPELIAEIGGYAKDESAAKILESGASSFPGIATPYADIRMLTPNTLITLPESRISRFFPREPLPTREFSDSVLDEIASLLKRSAELLAEQGDLSLSLTAGVDSRLSLAATKTVSDKVTYKTWVKKWGGKEVSTVENLCNNLGIGVDIVHLDEDPPEAFLSDFKKNTSGMSKTNRGHTAFNLAQSYPEEVISIRSNVAEIARTFYRDIYGFLPDEIDKDVLAKLYAHQSDARFVQSKFQEFIDVTGFTQENIYNYDLYDLFYWEYRMGNWLCLWLLEFSTALEEFVLYNNRHLLKLMLSIDQEYRKSDELFYELIKRLWPECLEVPINPHKDPPLEAMTELERIISGAIFRLPPSLYMDVLKVKRRVL